MPTDAAHAAMSTREVLRFGPVRALMVASFVLFTGTALQAAALGLQAYNISGREADLGWIGLCEFLPAAALVLVTGSVADRFDRKKVALLAIGGEVVCSVALLLFALTDPTEVWPLFIIAVGYGVARAFLAPSTRPMPAMVAPEGGLPRVVAMWSATWTGATILGPAASGLLFAVHPSLAYGVSTSMIMLAGVLIASLHFVRQPERPAADDKPTFRSAIEGLVFVRRTPILLAAIGLDLFAVLFGGAVALLPAIAEDRLGVGDVGYGFLRAAPGAGAALMAVFLAFRPLKRHIGRNLLYAVLVFGAATVALGLTRSYVVAFAALVVLAGADMISVFIRGSLVPLVTPDEKRGRVMAVENVFIGASNELGAFESGIVAQAVGTPATVIGGGIATIVVVGVWWLGFPSLRRVDRFEDLGH
ncbi:MAG TPA: MFS transporter [Ilumatobacteraceae bacterium]|nr:MFS transporter [Ilumatobacteraceae bacterium]